jgi:metal-responsive CopG/Arc/MetJ family transcriptional regulator
MRNKLSEDKKRVDVSLTIDAELLQILEEHLDKNDISNRSKYIEKLIREDFEKKGKNIVRKF